MKFKRKLGTVDAHNVNLNFTPDNTDSHDIILNFEHLATGSTNLNFGDDVTAEIDTLLDVDFNFEVGAVYADSGVNTSTIDTVLDAEFQYSVHAVFSENTDVIAQIDYVLDAELSLDVQAVFAENLCTVDTVLDTEFQFQIDAVFDINHIVGVSYAFDASYQKAIAALSVAAIPWAKPILRVSNEALFFDQGLVVSHGNKVAFERGLTLSESIHAVFDQGEKLSRNLGVRWQENLKIRIARDLYFDESIKLRLNREFDHQEMIRKRRNISFSHQVAHVFEKRFSFDWDKGLELVTQDVISWDKAKSIHYRKHPIEPWPDPEIPEYQGTGDLNFVCLCHEVDSHDVVLNFGADDCIPGIPNRNWWYILNSLSVTRLDNGVEIEVYDGNYSTDRSSWCWSYSLTVPAAEIGKLEPINGQPVILKIIVNGTEHQMLLENRRRSRKFAQDTYTLIGRSQTALLAAPTAPLRSFLQENDRTSVQLCQAELDRVFSDTVLNWQLIDALGWIVERECLSYSNLAPIDAIKMVVESGGGFIYSEKGSNTLTIKPLYKKTFWDVLSIAEYDRLLPESVVLSQSTDYQIYPDYNGITLTNDRKGPPAQVKRTGTSADILLQPDNNPLFNYVSMKAYGKAKLAKAGMVETHTYSMPISPEVGECVPGEVLAFNAEWWGIVDSVSVSFSHAVVNQTVKVERVNRE
ncbi:hypothetical protein [Acinetobacter johnsonii]|uniref:Uncharacterized protein n=1 Tax=Acinetobacter johnsonii TaxID=40214 RepID=A0A380TW89_ACIJO|nr:hypothetical protein [Acinetobacter johnsonii]ENU40358.1 hypothetical protein F986_00871 [Acinetobacter johnsonii CIP 64.6]QPS02627.1 hypothetical protein I6G67_10225 [Acinetobacter johnsonii]SUT92226.1 Uncharacterised protein [Acinetobacter johnsonii]